MRASAGPALLVLASMAYASTNLSIPFASQLLDSSSTPARISSAYPLYFLPGVRVPPNYSFSIGFLPNTFTSSESAPLSCQASYAGSPLPTWLLFDSATVTLDGVAPSFPQSLNVSVSCSDGSDAAAADWFLIQVGKHALEVEVTPKALVAMGGNSVQYDASPILNLAAVDGTEVSAKQSIDLQMDLGPLDWLHWNS